LAIALSVLSFFWPLHCLFFCDLQLLITHLVSSNFKLVFSVWFFFIIDVVYLLSESEVRVVVQTYWLWGGYNWCCLYLLSETEVRVVVQTYWLCFFFIIDVVYLLSETEVKVVVQTYWLLDLIRWLVCRFDRLTFTIPKQCNQYLNECPSISELGNHSPIWLTCLFGPFVLHTSSSSSKI
jgi:hypothetical protein